MVSVEVFDVLGRTLYNNKNVNQKALNISSITNNSQPLIVKIVLENGETVTKKIIL